MHIFSQLQKCHRGSSPCPSPRRIQSPLFRCVNSNGSWLHDGESIMSVCLSFKGDEWKLCPFSLSEHRPNCILRASENPTPRHWILQRRSRHPFPVIVDRWWYCDRADATVGRSEDTRHECQTGRIRQFGGNHYAHGQIGSGRFLQRLRAGIRSPRATHCHPIDVDGTIENEFRIRSGHRARPKQSELIMPAIAVHSPDPNTR